MSPMVVFYYTLYQLVYQTTDRNDIPLLYACKQCEHPLPSPLLSGYNTLRCYKLDSIIRIDLLPHEYVHPAHRPDRLVSTLGNTEWVNQVVQIFILLALNG